MHVKIKKGLYSRDSGTGKLFNARGLQVNEEGDLVKGPNGNNMDHEGNELSDEAMQALEPLDSDDEYGGPASAQNEETTAPAPETGGTTGAEGGGAGKEPPNRTTTADDPAPAAAAETLGTAPARGAAADEPPDLQPGQNPAQYAPCGLPQRGGPESEGGTGGKGQGKGNGKGEGKGYDNGNGRRNDGGNQGTPPTPRYSPTHTSSQLQPPPDLSLPPTSTLTYEHRRATAAVSPL